MTLDAFDVALEVFDVTLEESGRRVLNGTGVEMVCKCLRELLFTFAQSASQAAEAVGFFFDRSFFPTWALLAAKTCLQHHNVKI